MQKRERLERAIAGESLDRVPVALWRHWPGDDQRYADLARSVIDFQHDYNWDFVRVMPSRNFQVVDFGVQDAWLGNPQGLRQINRRVIERSLAWTEIRPLSPDRGALARQIECLKLIGQAMNPDRVPVLQTIYSPMIQAAQMAGRQKLLRDMRLRPDRLRTGLNQLTESTLRFLEALGKLEFLSGVFLVTAFANHDIMPESEYAAFGMPPINQIMSALPEAWWLNALQVNGSSPMLHLFSDLPVQVLNWDTRADTVKLTDAKSLFSGACCGGLNDQHDLLHGTPGLLSSVIRDALNQSEARRFILSGSGNGYATTPISNIRAVRRLVES